MMQKTRLPFERRRSIAKTCPCGKSNSDGKFSPFKGYTDKGFCHSCGKSFFPNDRQLVKQFDILNHPKKVEAITYLPLDVLESSVLKHSEADFFSFLQRLFKSDLAHWLCLKYHVGSNKNGLTAFWQVDISGNVRQCKVIPYQQDGHRDHNKVIKEYIDKDGDRHQIRGCYQAGKEILKRKANLQQCFFGENLLSFPENNSKPVALVESEKSAIVASVFLPQFTWLATGGKVGCKWTEFEVCKVLKGRHVVLFPDLGAFELWNEKSKLLANVAECRVTVSDLLEKKASKKQKEEKKLDIADSLTEKTDSTGMAFTDDNYPIFWDHKK